MHITYSAEVRCFFKLTQVWKGNAINLCNKNNRQERSKEFDVYIWE